MLDKIKENKGKILGNFSALVVGLILTAIVGTLNDESLGYSLLVLYTYVLFAHKKVSNLISDKIK